jgi:hypothetical protein
MILIVLLFTFWEGLNIEDLYITNYCDKRCSPLKSITRLSNIEAHTLAKELSRYSDTKFTSFSRFTDEDFDGYLNKRILTEKWLRSKVERIGIKPKNISPLYFVLGESTYLNQWYQDGIKTKILLNQINDEDVSFTYGDSMSKMDSDDRMDPFNKETLLKFIKETTNDVTSFLINLNQQNRYIEVQLWNDIYINDFCCHKE